MGLSWTDWTAMETAVPLKPEVRFRNCVSSSATAARTVASADGRNGGGRTGPRGGQANWLLAARANEARGPKRRLWTNMAEGNEASPGWAS